MDRSNEKFDYFMRRTEQDLKDLKFTSEESFKRLNSKIDKLWTFRLLFMGGAMAISGVTTLAIDIIFIYFGIHK